MASKPKARKRGRYLRGRVDESLQLSTLAANALVSNTWDEAAVERTLISSIVSTWTLSQLTAPQGPVIFGVAHSDYTDAEIEEVIENAGSWDPGDKISQERAKRLVRQIGVFNADDSQAGPMDVTINEGQPVKTKLNWVLTTGDTLKMWAFNTGEALSTTDPQMRAEGHANLWVL